MPDETKTTATAPTGTAPAPTKPKPGPALRIAARREGYRRCGRAFSAKPTDFKAGEFTADQAQILLKDSGLVVTELE